MGRHSGKRQCSVGVGRFVEITGATPVEDLVRELPQSVRILARRGVVCIRCGEPYWGTLGELAAEKGITDLEPVLEELRAATAD